MSNLSCDYIFSDFIDIKVFVALSAALVLLFVYLFIKTTGRSRVGDFGLLFLTVGSFLNLYERLKLGCVRDYINFLGLFSFNIQDLLVTMGIILTVWVIWKKK